MGNKSSPHIVSEFDIFAGGNSEADTPEGEYSWRLVVHLRAQPNLATYALLHVCAGSILTQQARERLCTFV